MSTVKSLLILSFAFLSVYAQIYPLTPVVTENGFINLSLDAFGTNDVAGGYIQVNKPNNAIVRSAYLVGATNVTIFSSDWEFGISSNLSTIPQGATCAVTKLNINYENSRNYQIITPTIYVSYATMPRISYYDWMAKESCCD